MNLLDIKEPEENDSPEEQQKEPAIGIDLGTTNSLVATSEEQKVKILTNSSDSNSLPSRVYITDKNEIYTTDEDKDSAPYSSLEISSIKRLMGKSSDEAYELEAVPSHIKNRLIKDDKTVRIKSGDKSYTPVEISAKILRSLKQRANQYFEVDEVTKSVITVPAYFDEASRNATKDAARVAGLETLRLISEPTAAALAYGLENDSEGMYLVYDLGGGTFDVSLLNMTMGVFQVVATGGDAMLGGDDIDREIAYKFSAQLGLDYSNTAMQQELLQVAKSFKQELGTGEVNEKTSELTDGSKVSLTARQLEEILKPFIDKTLNTVEEVIQDSEIDSSEIKGIILVGGSTRLASIKQALNNKFGLTIYDDIDPDTVVAAGAAIQAENLTAGSNNLLLDVTPLSIGLELMGGIVEKVVPRNTAIPTKVSQEFTTYADNQTAMSFNVVQGDREFANKCRSLCQFELKGIPPMKAGVPRIKVEFSIDADGLLFISAYETLTGNKQEVAVNPSYGISEDEILGMLKEAMENATTEHEERLLAETKTEARGMIDSINNALSEESISAERERQIKQAMKDLEGTLESSDRDNILNKMDELGKVSEKFFTEKMNRDIQKALSGKEIKEAEDLTK
jgi:molecular chaperone HscA